MLTEILNRLNEGRAYSTAELAMMIDISPDVLAAELDYLRQIGAIRTIGENIHCHGCTSCGGSCGCQETTGITMWEKR